MTFSIKPHERIIYTTHRLFDEGGGIECVAGRIVIGEEEDRCQIRYPGTDKTDVLYSQYFLTWEAALADAEERIALRRGEAEMRLAKLDSIPLTPATREGIVVRYVCPPTHELQKRPRVFRVRGQYVQRGKTRVFEYMVGDKCWVAIADDVFLDLQDALSLCGSRVTGILKTMTEQEKALRATCTLLRQEADELKAAPEVIDMVGFVEPDREQT